MQKGRFCDDIVGRASMERTKGHNRSLNRIYIAADNGLHLGNKVASRHQSIIGFMRKGRMPPFPLKGQLDFTGTSKKRSSISGNIANFEIRPHMEAVKLIRQPVAKGTIFIHEHSASFIFLSRLKEKEQIVGRLSAHSLLQQS